MLSLGVASEAKRPGDSWSQCPFLPQAVCYPGPGSQLSLQGQPLPASHGHTPCSQGPTRSWSFLSLAGRLQGPSQL